ncbi:hypothetical protein, partial [Rufibacter sp. XAAS-G3-1]|uniref:hypothetical protein n=1 Tax=Rufibacter sp. XAAS-G3-1 TaxID=2729134 RepID=UPI001C630CD5
WLSLSSVLRFRSGCKGKDFLSLCNTFQKLFSLPLPPDRRKGTVRLLGVSLAPEPGRKGKKNLPFCKE